MVWKRPNFSFPGSPVQLGFYSVVSLQHNALIDRKKPSSNNNNNCSLSTTLMKNKRANMKLKAVENFKDRYESLIPSPTLKTPKVWLRTLLKFYQHIEFLLKFI